MIALRKVKGSPNSLELSSGVNVSTSLVPAYGSSEKSDPLAADEKSVITNVSSSRTNGYWPDFMSVHSVF